MMFCYSVAIHGLHLAPKMNYLPPYWAGNDNLPPLRDLGWDGWFGFCWSFRFWVPE
jgi:hypothetical protein